MRFKGWAEQRGTIIAGSARSDEDHRFAAASARSPREYCRQMTDTTEQVAALLHEAAEAHHVVYRIVDGDDPDWASWYADWLLSLSELPELLRESPVRSHLDHALVQFDRDYMDEQPQERWEDWYARRLLERWG